MSDKQHPVYADEYEKEVHLTDYLNVVLRRWKLVLLVFLLVFGGVAVKTYHARRRSTRPMPPWK